MQHGVNDEVRVLKECVKKLEGDVRPSRQRGESAGLVFSTLDVNAWE